MFIDNECFGFHGEVMDLVDSFLRECEAVDGGFDTEVDKALAASFALGALRDDLNDIWQVLSGSEMFGPASPRALFRADDYRGRSVSEDEKRQTLLREIRSRGWLP